MDNNAQERNRKIEEARKTRNENAKKGIYDKQKKAQEEYEFNMSKKADNGSKKRGTLNDIESGGQQISGSNTALELKELNSNGANSYGSVFFSGKLRGVKTEKVLSTTETIGKKTISSATGYLYMVDNETASGVAKLATVASVGTSIAMAQVKKSTRKTDTRDYMNYLKTRNGNEYTNKRELYIKQLNEINEGKRTKLDKDVIPSKLDRAITDGNIKTIKSEETKRINAVLNKYGINKVPRTTKDANLVLHITKTRLKGEIPNELKDAINASLRLNKVPNKQGMLRALRGASYSALGRQLRQGIRKSSNRNGTGRGIYQTLDITNKTKRLIAKAYRNITHAIRSVALATRKIQLAKLKKALKLLQSDKAAKKGQLDSAKKRVEKYNKKQKKVDIKRAKRAESKKVKRRSKRQIRRDLRRQRVSSLLGNTWLGKKFTIAKNFLNNKFKKLAGSKIGKLIGKLKNLFKGLIKLLSVFKEAILIAIGAVTAFLLLTALVQICASYIMSLLDVSEVDNKTIMTLELQDCYLDDMYYICQAYEGNGYVVTFEDVRDNEEYISQSENSEHDVIWYQCSNIAEICSMTYTRFEFDLESYKTETIANYARELYYGSHEITGSVYGNTGSIIYKTYYFNSLFNRIPKEGEMWTPSENLIIGREDHYHSPDLVEISTSLGSLNEKEQEVYDTLINSGFSSMAACAIMGNIYAESNFDPLCGMGTNNAFGLYQFEAGEGYEKEKFMEYIGAVNEGDLLFNANIQNETEFMIQCLENNLNTYTGCSRVFHYYRVGQSSGTTTTDTSKPHVWVKTKYTLDEYKSWSADSNLPYELVEDFIVNGQQGMLNMTGEEVKSYLDSLSNEDKAVAYATLLYTRVYEKPSTRDWITQRVQKAVEYYHKVGGYTGSVIAYAQGHYEAYRGDWGWCGIASESMIMATFGIQIDGHLIDPCELVEYQERTLGVTLQGATHGGQWGCIRSLLNGQGCKEVTQNTYKNDTSSGVKYILLSSEITENQLLEHLQQGHLVMIQTGCTAIDGGTMPFKCSGSNGTYNHWAIATGLEKDGIIVVDPGIRSGDREIWASAYSIVEDQGCNIHSYVPCATYILPYNKVKNLQTVGGKKGTNYTKTLIMWED